VVPPAENVTPWTMMDDDPNQRRSQGTALACDTWAVKLSVESSKSTALTDSSFQIVAAFKLQFLIGTTNEPTL